MTTAQTEFVALVSSQDGISVETVVDEFDEWGGSILVRATDDGMVLSAFVNLSGDIEGDWF